MPANKKAEFYVVTFYKIQNAAHKALAQKA